MAKFAICIAIVPMYGVLVSQSDLLICSTRVAFEGGIPLYGRCLRAQGLDRPHLVFIIGTGGKIIHDGK